MPHLLRRQAASKAVDAAGLPWFDSKHPSQRQCPGCGGDATRTALVDLAYTFETCDCVRASYVHLVETLWHRTCITRSGG